jgi:hypothetical protein
LRTFFRLTTSSPERGAGRKVEGHGLTPPRRLDPVDLIQLLHPALHLRRMRGARLEALDEFYFFCQHGLLPLELGLLLLFILRALLLIKLVVARIGGQRTAVDLHHLGDDTIHEFAVVRGHQQQALIALEEFLKPDQAFQIEVVARLVEQHRVGAHDENAGKGDAHLPAARQRADVAIHHLLAEAQPRKHLAGGAFQVVAASSSKRACTSP